MNLLLVEDEKTLQLAIRVYLEKQGYAVTTADTLHQSLDEVIFIDFDCVVVDIGLPDGNGLDLIRRLKAKRANSRIVIISARNTLEDKVTGLELGSDDYITKPFDLPELNARIRSALRRSQPAENNPITFGSITLDPFSHQVSIGDKPLTVTQKEYELLFYFMTNPNHLIDKSALARHIWGMNMDLVSYDFMYTHIRNLRRKLTDTGCPDYLKTRYGVGYIFTDHEAAP